MHAELRLTFVDSFQSWRPSICPWCETAKRGERIRALEAALRKYGGHARDCAYIMGHYKGPTRDCDCNWINAFPAAMGATEGETIAKPDDPNAPFRWICIHCTTVNAVDTDVCLGCRKPRYPTLHSDRGAKP